MLNKNIFRALTKLSITLSFLLFAFILFVPQESSAFSLTSDEQRALQEQKTACAEYKNNPLNAPLTCVDEGERIVRDSGFIAIEYWINHPTCSCKIMEENGNCAKWRSCAAFRSHWEQQELTVTNTTPNECSTSKKGSIINVDQMSVGESVPIVGTPFSLNYSSERVPGNLGNYRLRVPLFSPDASSVKLQVDWLNQQLQKSLAAQGTYDFVWNGLDSAGQEVPGPIQATVRLEHDYCNSLFCNPGHPITTTHWLGSFNARRFGLGGWSLSPLHYMKSLIGDLPATLYLGDGSQRTVTPQAISNGAAGEAWRVVDESGAAVFTFDAQGRHLYTRNGLTNALLYKFTYNANGHLTAITDSFNNQTRILRNTQGAVTGIRSPDGLVTGIARNADGWISRITNPNAEAFTLSYKNAQGLLKTFRKPGGQISTFTYDLEGRLLKDSSSAGSALSLALQNESSLTRSIKTTTAQGRSATLESTSNPYSSFNPNTGRYDQVFSSTATDEAGVETSTYYIPGRNFGFTIGGGYTSGGISYTENYGPDPRFGISLPVAETFSFSQGGYNSQGTINRTVQNNSATPTPFNYTSLSTSVDINGKISNAVYTRTTGETTITTPKNRSGKIVTDTFALVKQIKSAGLAPLQYRYDTRGRLTDIQQGLRTTAISYDAAGWVSSIADAFNQVRTLTHDKAGRVTSLTLPDSRVVDFSYDANGNLTEVSPPGRPAHVLKANGFDLLDTYTPPLLSGVTTVATRYTYNKDRQITKILRPDGQAIVFNYQPGSSTLASITTPEGKYMYGFTNGLINSAVAPNGIRSNFTWSGELLNGENVQSKTGTSLGSVALTYDNDFRPINITINDASGVVANTAAFAYDLDGLLVKAGSMSLTRAAETGFLTKTALGGVSETYGYDATYGELANHAASVSAFPVFSETLVRDDLGRIVSKIEKVQGVDNSYGYTYDSAGRLTDVKHNNAVYSHYDYDENSNRVGGIQGGASVSALYDDQDRLLSYGGKTYMHTANGELQSVTTTADGKTTAFSYDVAGNLKQVLLPDGGKVGYQVDGLNRRISRSVNGVVQKRYLYQSQLQIAAELSLAGKLVTRFIYGSKSHVPDYMVRSGLRYKYITDHLGSVRLVVNVTTGTVAQQLDYDEFGRVLKDTSPGFQPFAYAGGLYDPVTKLVRFGARDYDAETGRWTAKDPILFGGGDSNLYGYTINNPLNFVDSLGLAPSYDFQSAIDATLMGVVAGAIGAGEFGLVTTGIGAIPAAIIGGVVGGIIGFTGDAVSQAVGTIVPGYSEIYSLISLITDPIGALPTINGDSQRPNPMPIPEVPVKSVLPVSHPSCGNQSRTQTLLP